MSWLNVKLLGGVDLLTPIQRITVTQSILNELLNSIKSGMWKNGEKLPSETELAVSFQAGRNSVREAIKTLNSMGVLDSKPGHGTFLSENALKNLLTADLITNGFTEASFEEIAEVRNLIEAQSAYWAALRASDGDLQEIGSLLDKSISIRKSALSELNDLHMNFHILTVRIAGNSLLLKLYRTLCAEAEIQRKEFDLLSDKDQRSLILDQEMIMKCIIEKKPTEARTAMERHVEKGVFMLKKLFSVLH